MKIRKAIRVGLVTFCWILVTRCFQEHYLDDCLQRLRVKRQVELRLKFDIFFLFFSSDLQLPRDAHIISPRNISILCNDARFAANIQADCEKSKCFTDVF